MSYFDSAVLLDEADRTALRETGSTDVLRTQVAGGCQFLQLEFLQHKNNTIDEKSLWF